MIQNFLLFSNPFFDSYIHSDILGKLIFIGLIILSITTWVLLLYKLWQTYQAKKTSKKFQEKFYQKLSNPLGIQDDAQERSFLNPFREIYTILKKYTLEILSKNQRFSKEHKPKGDEFSYLSPSDIDFVQTHLMTTVASQTKYLESNLFILATIVTLAPFLGLLGTVWGILTTFSELQVQGGGAHHTVLNGLSLALATTVLGLVDAIPALVGYNYLKNSIRNFEIDMEGFAHEILASVEIQYRKVDLH